MTRHATEYERADHYRDHLKHEPRPTDPLPALPLHVQSAPIAGALEVAILVQAVPLEKGAQLIEQFARTFAEGEKLELVAEAYNRIDKALSEASDASA